jgi:hypothetical protein
MGLNILLRIRPSLVHAKFKGVRIIGVFREIIKKRMEQIRKSHPLKEPTMINSIPIIKNMEAKVIPKEKFENHSVSSSLSKFSCIF